MSALLLFVQDQTFQVYYFPGGSVLKKIVCTCLQSRGVIVLNDHDLNSGENLF